MVDLSPRRGFALPRCVAGALLLGTLALAGCDRPTPKMPDAEQRGAAAKLAQARRLQQACGSAQTYDRLKAYTFDEASRLRAGQTAILERVGANATVRMENPVAVSRDEQLDVTVCRGRLILDLPPDVADAFNGERQLKAEVEYSAQAAADGSGLVYQMKGAEPIIYRLAALTLPTGAVQAEPATVPAPPAPTREVAARDEAPPALPSPPPPRPRQERVAPTALPQTAPPPPPRPAPPVRLPPPPTESIARPSFSCARVTGRVLRMICADPALAAKDRRMSSMFYAALAGSDDTTRAALRDSRDRFLTYRGRCATAGCVALTYDGRIAEIRDLAARH